MSTHNIYFRGEIIKQISILLLFFFFLKSDLSAALKTVLYTSYSQKSSDYFGTCTQKCTSDPSPTPPHLLNIGTNSQKDTRIYAAFDFIREEFLVYSEEDDFFFHFPEAAKTVHYLSILTTVDHRTFFDRKLLSLT